MNSKTASKTGHKSLSRGEDAAGPSKEDKKVPINKMRKVADGLVSKKDIERARQQLLWATLPPPNRTDVAPPQNVHISLHSDDRDNFTGVFSSEVFTREGKLLAEVHRAGGGDRSASVTFTDHAKAFDTFTQQELESAIRKAKAFVTSEVDSDIEY